MRKTIVVSDLTGTEFESTETVNAAKLMIDGESGERDLTPAEIEAFTAFIRDGESGPLRTLLTPAPAPARKSRSGAAKRTGDAERNAQMRDWARTPEGEKATGHPASDVPEKGRLPGWIPEAFEKTHPTIPAAKPEKAPKGKAAPEPKTEGENTPAAA